MGSPPVLSVFHEDGVLEVLVSKLGIGCNLQGDLQQQLKINDNPDLCLHPPGQVLQWP